MCSEAIVKAIKSPQKIKNWKSLVRPRVFMSLDTDFLDKPYSLRLKVLVRTAKSPSFTHDVQATDLNTPTSK
jgi:hypothetical protein